MYINEKEAINFDVIEEKLIKSRLMVQFEGTDSGQLFLNNVYFQNRNNDIKELADFKNVYQRFGKLLIINPDSISGVNPLGDRFYEKTNALIPLFDLEFDKTDVRKEEIIDQDFLQKL